MNKVLLSLVQNSKNKSSDWPKGEHGSSFQHHTPTNQGIEWKMVKRRLKWEFIQGNFFFNRFNFFLQKKMFFKLKKLGRDTEQECRDENFTNVLNFKNHLLWYLFPRINLCTYNPFSSSLMNLYWKVNFRVSDHFYRVKYTYIQREPK